jgi:hypothetical protein
MSMPLTDLHAAELDVVKECLRAAVDGPFFPDWELHALFGLERAEVRKVLQSWPELNELTYQGLTLRLVQRKGALQYRYRDSQLVQ